MTDISKKNEDLLAKNQVSGQEVVKKQLKKKAEEVSSNLNKYLETNEEYDARIKELEKKDAIVTNEIKLRNINIPGHTSIWASTDPQAKPSIRDLQARGYRVVSDIDYVPTGSHSIEGAGFHILMTCPNHIADRRKNALAEKAKDQYNRVFKKKVEDQESDDDFLYAQNKIKVEKSKK